MIFNINSNRVAISAIVCVCVFNFSFFILSSPCSPVPQLSQGAAPWQANAVTQRKSWVSFLATRPGSKQNGIVTPAGAARS